MKRRRTSPREPPLSAGEGPASPSQQTTQAQQASRQRRGRTSSPQASTDGSEGAWRASKRLASQAAAGSRAPARHAPATGAEGHLDTPAFSLQRLLDDQQVELDLPTLEGLAPLLAPTGSGQHASSLFTLRLPLSRPEEAFPPFPVPEAAQQHDRAGLNRGQGSSSPARSSPQHPAGQGLAGFGPGRHEQAWSAHTPTQHPGAGRRAAFGTPLSSDPWLGSSQQPARLSSPLSRLRGSPESAPARSADAEWQQQAALRQAMPGQQTLLSASGRYRPHSPAFCHDASYRLPAAGGLPQHTSSRPIGLQPRQPERSPSAPRLQAGPEGSPADVPASHGSARGREVAPLHRVLMQEQAAAAALGPGQPSPEQQQQMHRSLAEALRSSSGPQLERRLSPASDLAARRASPLTSALYRSQLTSVPACLAPAGAPGFLVLVLMAAPPFDSVSGVMYCCTPWHGSCLDMLALAYSLRSSCWNGYSSMHAVLWGSRGPGETEVETLAWA